MFFLKISAFSFWAIFVPAFKENIAALLRILIFNSSDMDAKIVHARAQVKRTNDQSTTDVNKQIYSQ